MVEQLSALHLDLEAVARYLRATHGGDVEILEARELDGPAGDTAHKAIGFGRPWLISFRHEGREKKLVFRSLSPNRFGRERDDDRVAAVWLDFRTFNSLPQHVPAVDMVMRTRAGDLQSIAGAAELLLVTAYRPGSRYADDLRRIRNTGRLEPEDMRRAEALAAYLASIHERRLHEPALWRRRLRDLVGSGEGIMGLTASFPPGAEYAGEATLRKLEELANRWRWRLMPREERLCQVHGDFHPFNILFDATGELILLDRSRGEWGEAADDVGCLAVNYLFFGVQAAPRLASPFRALHDRFWQVYLERAKDREMPAVVAPWMAWRLLVLASPQWYPNIPDRLRAQLLTFARLVMYDREYDFTQPERYLEIRE